MNKKFIEMSENICEYWEDYFYSARERAEQVLIDNGIDADEAPIVLQAIGYVLLDTELYPDVDDPDYFEEEK